MINSDDVTMIVKLIRQVYVCLVVSNQMQTNTSNVKHKVFNKTKLQIVI